MRHIAKVVFFTAFILPLQVIMGYYLGGWWNFLALFQAFVIIPSLDHWMGTDSSNVPKNEVKVVSEEKFYKFVLFFLGLFPTGFCCIGFLDSRFWPFKYLV